MDRKEMFFDILGREMVMTLATGTQGNVSMRAVSPAVYGKDILIFTSPESKKYAQMKENPYCCVSVGPFFANASVRFCGDTMKAENKALRDAYNAKFPGAFDEGVEFGGRHAEFLLLTPTTLYGWAYGDGSMTGEGIPTVPFEAQF